MTKNKLMVLVMVSLLGAAGGCKKKDAGGAKPAGGSAAPAAVAPAGGPTCEVAATAYVKALDAGGGNYLRSSSFSPTPAQVAEVTTMMIDTCKTTNWSEKAKTCLAAETDGMKVGKCFGDAMASARVQQVIFDKVKAWKDAAPAAGSGSAAPAAGSGSAAPAAGSGSATK